MEIERERFLKNARDGYIHGWNQWLAQEPNMVEVTEMEAYPERFVKGGKRKAAVDMTTEEPAEPVSETNLLTGEQAGKNADAKTGGKGFLK